MDARLLAVTVGNFTTATGAFLVVGLLNEISADLGVSIAIAGLLGSAFAPSFAVLFGLRMVTGGTVGSYVPASVSTAGVLIPAEQRSRAVFMVGIGASLGQVIGVPAGVWIGGALGWRVPFVLIGVMGLMICVWLWRILPARLMAATFNLASWGEVRRNKAILGTLGVTALQGAGGFVTLAFVAPLLKQSIGATPGTISLMLGLFGLSGVVCSLIALRVMDRFGPTRLGILALGTGLGSIIVATLGLAALTWASFAIVCTALTLFVVSLRMQRRPAA